MQKKKQNGTEQNTFQKEYKRTQHKIILYNLIDQNTTFEDIINKNTKTEYIWRE